MLPEIDVFGLELKTFGIFFALNFVAWGVMVAVRLRELGRPPDWAYEMVFCALGGGIVGAKLYWAIDNGQLTLSGLFSGSGLTWYGGLIGGAAVMVLWAKWRGWLGMELLAIAGIGLPLGYAVGRIGCQVSGDGDYGTPSDLPWAMAYPDGVVPTDDKVHPTPIYESVSMGLLAWVLWRLRDAVHPGALFALYLLFGGLERFLVEFVRRNDDVLAGLTQAQVISVGMMIAGVVWLALLSRGGGLRVARPAPRPATA